MAAGFNWNEYNGANTAETSIGTGGNITNFMAVDSPGTTGYDSNPITAGKNSMEKYLKADFTGTFNKINKMVLYKFSLINGEHLRQYAMATLKKAICHLQRLSERTLLWDSEAIVRTYVKA